MLAEVIDGAADDCFGPGGIPHLAFAERNALVEGRFETTTGEAHYPPRCRVRPSGELEIYFFAPSQQLFSASAVSQGCFFASPWHSWVCSEVHSLGFSFPFAGSVHFDLGLQHLPMESASF